MSTEAVTGDGATYDYPQDSLHGAPTAAELVTAVKVFLEDEVMPATDGTLSFHARVAINVCRMVERELALGADQAAAHADRLASLGVSTERELADAIRRGDLDDRRDELVAALRGSVRDKLLVANPRYLGDAG